MNTTDLSPGFLSRIELNATIFFEAFVVNHTTTNLITVKMSECMILRPKFAPPTKQLARPTTAPANPVASRAENYNRKNGTSEYIPVRYSLNF